LLGWDLFRAPLYCFVLMSSWGGQFINATCGSHHVYW
jgi:hypothetical protein